VLSLIASEHSKLREADGSVATYNDVIDQPYLDKRTGFADAGRYQLIRVRRLADARGVWVGYEDGRGVVLERTLDYFSRMDAGTIDGSAEDLLAGNDRMAIREVHDRENLMLKVGKSDCQILLRIFHVLDDGALGDSLREDPECRADDLGIHDRHLAGL
jgi:hypothetical protein